jgi:hypothetical protein
MWFEQGEQTIRQFLAAELADVIADLMDGDTELRHSVDRVQLAAGNGKGASALSPFEELPPETLTLHGAVYSWYFSFLGKLEEMHTLRFLDPDLMGSFEVDFLVDEPESFDAGKIKERIEAAFETRHHFHPRFLYRAMESDPMASSNKALVYGDPPPGEMHSAGFYSRMDYDEHPAHLPAAARGEPGSAQSEEMLWSRAAIRNYYAARNASSAPAAVDLTPHWLKEESEWHRRNKPFFELLLRGEYDQLIVTQEAEDIEGSSAPNDLAVCPVEGLRAGEETIPAHEVMLKLRGFQHYRGEVNNRIDLIKEYVARAYIHRAGKSSLHHLTETGPMIFNLERINLSLPQENFRRCVGFFMRRISTEDGLRAITLRVHNLTDFWRLSSVVSQAMDGLGAEGADPNTDQLRAKLVDLISWLWANNLSIDYCDLMFVLDQQATIQHIWLLDLERLSYGELVNERHVLLDALYDVKSKVPKDQWPYVLKHAYLSPSSGGEIPDLPAISRFGGPIAKRRNLGLRGLRLLNRAVSVLNLPRRETIWKRIVTLAGAADAWIGRMR